MLTHIPGCVNNLNPFVQKDLMFTYMMEIVKIQDSFLGSEDSRLTCFNTGLSVFRLKRRKRHSACSYE